MLFCTLIFFPSSNELRLPVESFYRILAFLDPKDLVNLSYVSKEFFNLSSDNYLWKQLYETRWGKAVLGSAPVYINHKTKSWNERMSEVAKGSCCWKHKYLHQQQQDDKNEYPTSIRAGDVKVGDMIVLHGKCCQVVEVNVSKSGRH